MRWLVYIAVGFLTYWLLWGGWAWTSIGLWLVVALWPLVLIWHISWWLLKVVLAVGLALFVLGLAHDAWHRRKT